jgi:pimeloyl-ACP methyl ester carboxylesterase
MFAESFLLAGGGRRNVARGPVSGPPLVLMHGVGRRWQDFSPLLAGLAAQWPVVAPDHRGHGLSEQANRYLVPDYAADAAELLDSFGQPAVLIGHSLGALVALAVAAEHPDAVRAAVLLDPPSPAFLGRLEATPYAAIWAAMRRLAGGGRPVPDTARELAELRLPGPGGRPVRLGDLRDAAALRFMASCLHDLDPAVMTPALEGRWLGGFDPFAAAAAVRVPTLVVAADESVGGMLPAADAARLLAALPDGVRVDLPGVGHLAHWQDPAAVLRAIHAFLASL